MINKKEYDILYDDFVPIQEKDEMWSLLKIINEKVIDSERAFNVLETGLAHGGSTRIWHRLCENHSQNGLLIGIDLNPMRAMCMTCLDNAPSKFIKSDSTTQECFDYTQRLIQEESKEKDFDFIFLDSDHSWETVIREFELYSPLLKKNGLIAIHDYKDPNGGPRKAIYLMKKKGVLKPKEEGECISEITEATKRGIYWAVI